MDTPRRPSDLYAGYEAGQASGVWLRQGIDADAGSAGDEVPGQYQRGAMPGRPVSVEGEGANAEREVSCGGAQTLGTRRIRLRPSSCEVMRRTTKELWDLIAQAEALVESKGRM